MGRKRTKRYRVLVICGGGIFGYIPAHLIAGTGISTKGSGLADAFGGTSIGGILSLMLASGMRPSEVKQSFVQLSDKAFPDPSVFSKLWPWGPKFNGLGLEEALESLFGNKLLCDIKKPVVIPTIDFEHNKPKIYDNIVEDADMVIPVRTLARMTSAAPTYFPPKDGHIDGGLIANNPVLETAIALKAKKNIPFECMDVLVLGTGHTPQMVRDMDDVASWSSVQWLKPMLNYLTKANEMCSDYMAKEMGFRSYRLFDPVVIESDWDMADPDLIPRLIKRTEEYQEEFNYIFSEFAGLK